MSAPGVSGPGVSGPGVVWVPGASSSMGSGPRGSVCSRGCLLRGVWSRVSGPGGCLVPGASSSVGSGPGGSAPGGVGVCIPACTEADTPSPVNRMTDACKNITLAQLRCGR